MRFLIAILFLSLQVSLFSQEVDSCVIYIPKVLTIDCCEYGCEKLRVYTDCEIENYHFIVYNRWGEIMFETDDQDAEWNLLTGENGGVLSDGVYVWQIEGSKIADYDGDGDEEYGSFMRRGHFTNLR